MHPWHSAQLEPHCEHDEYDTVPLHAPVPVGPAVQPSQLAQPYWEPHCAQVVETGTPTQVPGVSQPWHPLQPAVAAHCWHEVYAGVPEHVGPVLKTWGGAAACACDVPQQILALPVQSSSDWHALGQVLWHTPSQQSCPVAAQSLDVLHALGHVSYIGLRHRPAALRLGSTLLTDVQHTSPMLVWQSLLALQAFGHSLPGKQIPWL